MTLRELPSWQPWVAIAGFAFLLPFPWEMLQAPFYADLAAAEHWNAVLKCTRAALGDAGIALVAFGAAAWRRRDRGWLGRPDGGALIAYLAAGFLITIGLEVVNVYALHRWAYSDSMPLLFGIGATPLVQWSLLPPINLWLAARHLGFRG